MTDPHFESLIKSAADAQSAREGESYKDAQSELSQIDNDALALQLRRDQVVITLETMDKAIADTQAAVVEYAHKTYLVTFDSTRDEEAPDPVDAQVPSFLWATSSSVKLVDGAESEFETCRPPNGLDQD